MASLRKCSKDPLTYISAYELRNAKKYVFRQPNLDEVVGQLLVDTIDIEEGEPRLQPALVKALSTGNIDAAVVLANMMPPVEGPALTVCSRNAPVVSGTIG